MGDYFEAFHQAIHDRKQVKVIVKRKHKSTPLIATCAPLDYGPKRDDTDGQDYFHFYKFPYKQHRAHIMSVEPDMLTKLTVLDDEFDPAAFIDWDTGEKIWTLPRDWGDFS